MGKHLALFSYFFDEVRAQFWEDIEEYHVVIIM